MVQVLGGLDLLAILGIVFIALLASTITLTVGLSIYSHVKRERRESVTEEVQDVLFSKLRDDDPSWGPWVDRLDTTQRGALRDLLEEYLEVVDGNDLIKLQALGEELGLHDWAADLVHDGGYQQTLRGLYWLKLLGGQIDQSILLDKCTGHPELEAAAVNLLRQGEDSDVLETGTELLLGGGSPLSIRGMDALYHLYEDDPDGLLAYAASHSDDWDIVLLFQVIRVLQSYEFFEQESGLEWLISLLDHDSAIVRAAVIRLLGGGSWQADLRYRLAVDELLMDPSVSVRKATYELLSAWGDPMSVSLLRSAALTESDERARMSAVGALADHLSHSEIRELEDIRPVAAWLDANEAIVNP